METNPEESTYLADFAHVAERMRQTNERLRAIEEQIKNAPKDRGPELSYPAPGFIRSRQPGHRDQWIASLEKHRNEVKAETIAWAEEALRDTDPTSARLVRDQVREDLYPNPFKEMDAAQKQKFRGQTRDLEQTQDYMDSMFTRNQPVPAKENTNPVRPGAERV